MRVKRLEIQGFKSFKDKTVVHFDHNVTGIVGPNGCGKSNIVDAFFWVMGEQSFKHMRGKGSDDLIFNGSSKYSPLGLAEATLVLETGVVDNESGPIGASARELPVYLRQKEISVTRRLYRGGEGEYLINGVPARLRDIQELFMDTGVGAKGYSVIEQGQIDRVVNAKPEERRKLIEEAAGIAKYKARKKESLKKMEVAQGNLDRLHDVIQEIERGVRSLERQAQKARKYQEYKTELFEKEMTWGRRRNRILKKRLLALSSESDRIEHERVRLKAEISRIESDLEAERLSQTVHTQNAEELQNQVSQLSAELTRAQSALNLSQQRQDDLQKREQELEAERAELLIRLSSDRASVTTAKAEFEGFESNHSEAERRLRVASEGLERERHVLRKLETDLQTTQRAHTRCIDEAGKMSARSASIVSQIESNTLRIEELSAESVALSEKLAHSIREVEIARAREAELKSEFETLKSKRAIAEATFSDKQREIKLRNEELNRHRSDLARLESRLESLIDLDLAREGASEGPKNFQTWLEKAGLSEVYPSVADCVRAKPGFEDAIESVFGPELEGWLVTRAQDAEEGFKYLRDQNKGRVYLKLKGLGETPIVDQEKTLKRLAEIGISTHGALVNFVETDEDWLKSILSSYFVVSDWAAVLRVLDSGTKLPDGVNLVSKVGECVRADGFLVGGARVSGAASLLQRKQEIDRLKGQVEDSSNEGTSLQRSLEEANLALEAAESEMLEIRDHFQQAQLKCSLVERDALAAKRAHEEVSALHARIDNELNRVRQLLEALTEERSEAVERLETLALERAEYEATFSELENSISSQREAFQTVEAQHSEAQIAYASLNERYSSLKRELQSSERMLKEREQRLEEVERGLQTILDERSQHSGGDTGLADRISEFSHLLSQKREELALAKDRLEQASSEMTEGMSILKRLHREADDYQQSSQKNAIEKERAEADLSYLRQNLEEKYGLGCLETSAVPEQSEMGNPVVTDEMTAEDELRLEEDVQELREKIRRLGEVNPNAVEEFEELRSRQDVLLSEKADLEDSIANLKDAIDHINKTSEERFSKAFDAIAARFEKLFPIVFGGGKAKLSLVYPEGSDDILECGVDILAQPPGKKIVNINVLSGGEKALTAVSLIFAIFMVKPSPFCLLDEVDAPLDDSNIGKFNTLLKEMSAKTQFIIITHNKKTMEMNDTLYGVTMEEPGVSKIVSIELH